VQLGTARIVDRVVEITHIGDLIEVVATREAALAPPPPR
jgi:hypothetical protein